MIPRARIVIHDEVNCQLFQVHTNNQVAQLDKATLTRCRNKLKFVNPAARYSTRGQLYGWSGDEYYCDQYGRTYFNLLDRLVPIIEEQGYEIEIEDNRKPKPDIKFELIDANYMSDINWPEGHRLAGQPVVLSDKQVEAINNFLAEPQQLAELATGFGKTLTCSALARKVLSVGVRMLIIVPDTGLVLQTTETLKQMGINAGCWYGAKKETDADVVVGTWQSLNALVKKKTELSAEQRAALLNNLGSIIVDECHGTKGDRLFELMKTMFNDVFIRWGMTGTIPLEERHTIKLIVAIGPVYQEVTSSELQEIGFLAKCNITVIQMKDTTKFVDYQSERKYTINDATRYQFWAQTLIAMAGTGDNVLVLVDNKVVGYGIESAVKNLGYEKVRFLSGDIKATDRKDQYKEVQTSDGEIAIATTAVASTGIDIPRIHVLVIIEIGKAFTKVVQSIGRALRLGSDKDHAEIYDFCSSMKYSWKHAKERQKFYKIKDFPFTVMKISDWRTA